MVSSRPSPVSRSSSSGLRSLLGVYAVALARLREGAAVRHSLLFWCLLGLAASQGLALSIGALNGAANLPALAGLALGWWLLVSLIVVGGAALLVAPDGSPVNRYGVPNGLTALRAWLCLPLLLVALLPLPGRLALALWAGVGGAVGLLDAADGFVARRWGPITALGKAMDPLMDALFFVAAAIGCYTLGITPLWLAALIVGRYAAPVILTPLVFLARKRPELVHTRWGRRNTILTGVVLFTLFWVRVAGGPVWLAAICAAIPTLVPTTLLHFAALAQRVRAAPVAYSR